MSRRKKMTIFGIVLLLIAASIFIYWRVAFARSCNPPLPRETVVIGGTMFSAEMARTLAEQACGLSGRTSLGDGEGMIFVFGTPSIQNFWMKDMHFPIDMVWIGGGKVLGFAVNAPVPPPDAHIWQLPIYTSPDGVDTVLEVPANTVTKNNIAIGDPVVITP